MLTPTILVTIRGPLKTVDMEVPGDVPISELVPILLEIYSSSINNPQAVLQTPVSLQIAGTHTPLSPHRTLIEADVCDGAVLVLQTKHAPATQPKGPELRKFIPKTVRPDVDTSGIGVSWEVLG